MLLRVSPFFCVWNFAFIQYIAIFASDYGVTVAPQQRLVKGNPVQVRNYTRSCKFVESLAFNSHCSFVGGKVSR